MALLFSPTSADLIQFRRFWVPRDPFARQQPDSRPTAASIKNGAWLDSKIWISAFVQNDKLTSKPQERPESPTYWFHSDDIVKHLDKSIRAEVAHSDFSRSLFSEIASPPSQKRPRIGAWHYKSQDGRKLHSFHLVDAGQAISSRCSSHRTVH
jgi:hypothetical protein